MYIEKPVLSVSCVTYNTDEKELLTAIQSLHTACIKAEIVTSTTIYLIDNGPGKDNLNTLRKFENDSRFNFSAIKVITGHGNIGYGAGNNLAIKVTNSQYHLVMNPDVIVHERAIAELCHVLKDNISIGLVAPASYDENGKRLYLAKRKPSVPVLLARFLNIPFLNRLLKSSLSNYEYRDIDTTTNTLIPIELASGCFMFCRADALHDIDGFNEKYFMYFEDFDLSLRMADKYQLMLNNKASITHFGGDAGRKGVKHIRYFCASALRFFLTW